MRQMRQSGSMRGVWKQGPRYGCSDTARRKGRKRIRRTYSSLRHTPTLPLKPLRAGTSGDSGVLVVTRVRSTTTKCTRGRGCQGHPAFPTPSLGGRFINASGASRREGEVVSAMRHRHSPMCKCTSWMRHLAQARNPYSLSWLWIPGSRGACHRAALCADPLARPGMTVLN
jgi:hypothetical protein